MQDRHDRSTTAQDHEAHIDDTIGHQVVGVLPAGIDDWDSFVDGDATPDVSTGSYWKTANTSATTITDFDNPKPNIQKITILFADANTTIQNSINIVIQADSNFTGEIDDVKVFLYDGTKWVEQTVDVLGSLVGVDYFLHDSDVSDIAGYDRLRRTPADQSETTIITGVSASDGDVAIEEFVTDEGDPDVLAILAGIWEFHVHANVNSVVGTTNLKIELYKRTAGGVETLIFSTEQEINSTSPVALDWRYTQTTDTTTNLTDRIVVKLLCNTTSVPSRTVTTYYEGSERAAHIHAPVDVGATAGTSHGDLAGLADDDHLQYLLTFIGANIGDIPYVNATGRLDLLAAELGSGFLVLNSRGPGLPPVWLDVQELIQFVTGGENVLFTFLSEVPISSLAIATAVASGAGGSHSSTPTVPLPAITTSTNVASGAGGSHGATSTVPISSMTTTTQVIP